MSVRIVPLIEGHWREVSAIYAEGIATGHATFESEPPDWAHFDAGRLPDHRHVAVENGHVFGWVAASPVSDRCSYAGVVEDSVYVAAQVRGQGIGLRLLNALINSTESAGIWTIQSGIFPENHASLRLHEQAGFRVVGYSTAARADDLRAARRGLARCCHDRTPQFQNLRGAQRRMDNDRPRPSSKRG